MKLLATIVFELLCSSGLVIRLLITILYVTNTVDYNNCCRYYLDEKVYYGVTNTEVKISTDDLHFPGISEKAAELLVERGVAAVGIDTGTITKYASGLYNLYFYIFISFLNYNFDWHSFARSW